MLVKVLQGKVMTRYFWLFDNYHHNKKQGTIFIGNDIFFPPDK